MKKKLFLYAAELCLSLVLIFSPINVGLSDFVYAKMGDYPIPGEDFSSELFYWEIAEGVKNSGQWLYFDKGDHISVCGYFGNDEHIIVPSEIDGKTVTELSYGGTSTEVHYSRDFFGSKENFFDTEEGSRSYPKHITIPDTVTRIGDNTFYECEYLEQADLPEGLTYVGKKAFGCCSSLEKADIPDTVTVIDDMAFCATRITSLDLPEGLEYIGDHAFSAAEITKLIIPDSVKYMGRCAFAFCWLLEEATLSANTAVIPEEAFMYCYKLRSLEIPEGVQIIESYAFEGCSELETLYIPSTVTVMSGRMLGSNYSLKDIYFDLDSETVTAMTGADPISYLFYYSDDTDYGNVTLHYAEKAEVPEKDPLWDDPVRTVFLVLGITFFLTFTAALCLYLVQKIKNSPKSAPKAAAANISQGNALTRLDPFDGIRCTKCGAESGKIADFCYNCGKKLKKKR